MTPMRPIGCSLPTRSRVPMVADLQALFLPATGRSRALTAVSRLATKLNQKTARVHFDALTMRDTPHGRRLVYGGHVISVCRVHSYDGLENVVGIGPINGGTR